MSIEEDIDYVRRWSQPWWPVFVVARSVKTGNVKTDVGRASVELFIKMSGVSLETIRLYQEMWRCAAQDGRVPYAEHLTGEEVNLKGLTEASWRRYEKKVTRKSKQVTRKCKWCEGTFLVMNYSELRYCSNPRCQANRK